MQKPLVKCLHFFFVFFSLPCPLNQRRKKKRKKNENASRKGSSGQFLRNIFKAKDGKGAKTKKSPKKWKGFEKKLLLAIPGDNLKAKGSSTRKEWKETKNDENKNEKASKMKMTRSQSHDGKLQKTWQWELHMIGYWRKWKWQFHMIREWKKTTIIISHNRRMKHKQKW